MSLFPLPDSDHELGFVRERMPRRRRFGWTVLVLALAATLVLSFVPSPYVIQQPGPVVNTLGTVEIDGEEVPLIDTDAETFPTTGSLDLLTVNVVGSRKSTPSWLDVALAWFNPSQAVVPLDLIFPPGTTLEESQEKSQIDMANSQKDAIAAALIQLGYEVPSTLTVMSLSENSASEGILQKGDLIVAMNGEKVTDLPGLRAALSAHGTESAVQLDILRDGKELSVEVTPRLSAEVTPEPVLGVGIAIDYEFPIDISIRLEHIGGPSAGMMFALGIIDTLTPGPLTGGKQIAGTGTINRDGTVGPIGGIRQKLFGAERAGADWFLAPQANCDEVVGHVPDGITVIAVSNLDEALDAVTAIGEGEAQGFPSCG